MDIFFIASLFILQFIFNSLSFAPITRQQTYFLLFLVIIYYLIFLFLYSFFKHIVLFFVKSILDKKSLKLLFDRIGKFYLLNIILFLTLFLVFFVLSLLAASVQEGIAPFVSLLILSLYSVFAYACVNMSHVLFYEGKSLVESLRVGTKFLTKFNKYYGVYLTIIFAFAIVFLLFTVFGNVLNYTVFQDSNALLQYGNVYTMAFTYAVGIIFYIGILFNRFYFYNILKEKFLK